MLTYDRCPTTYCKLSSRTGLLIPGHKPRHLRVIVVFDHGYCGLSEVNHRMRLLSEKYENSAKYVSTGIECSYALLLTI